MTSAIDRFTRDFKENKIGGKTILEWSKYLSSKDTTAFPVEHTGTLFKLDLLFSYLKFPYLHIMASQREKYNTKLIFVDLYSGNGLNKIRNDSPIFLCGSSLLALLASHVKTTAKKFCYFDHMVMIDNNQNSITKLKDRCNQIIADLSIDKILHVGTSFEKNSELITIRGNVMDENFISHLCSWLDSIWAKNKIHVMLFVDPDAPRHFSMESLLRLLRYPGDLITLLHPGTFAEMVLKKRYKSETIQTMLGVSKTEADSLFDIKSSKSLIDYHIHKFEEKIKNVTIDKLVSGSNCRNVIINIPIHTGQQLSYNLLFATRNTGGTDSSKWQKTLRENALEIGKMSDAGETILNILKGSQKRIFDQY